MFLEEDTAVDLATTHVAHALTRATRGGLTPARIRRGQRRTRCFSLGGGAHAQWTLASVCIASHLVTAISSWWPIEHAAAEQGNSHKHQRRQRSPKMAAVNKHGRTTPRAVRIP